MLLRFPIKKKLYSRLPQYTRRSSLESTLGPWTVRRGGGCGPDYSWRVSAVLSSKLDCHAGTDRLLPSESFPNSFAVPSRGGETTLQRGRSAGKEAVISQDSSRPRPQLRYTIALVRPRRVGTPCEFRHTVAGNSGQLMRGSS